MAMSKVDKLKNLRKEVDAQTVEPENNENETTIIDEIERKNGNIKFEPEKALSRPSEDVRVEEPVSVPSGPEMTPLRANVSEEGDDTAPVTTTYERKVIPKTETNYTITKGFSLDKETIDTLSAVVAVMQASGLKLDNRKITESSLLRHALTREFAYLERKNGKEFKEMVEAEKKKPQLATKFTI